MYSPSGFYRNEMFGRTQPAELKFQFNITGAKASSVFPAGAPVFSFYDAITQDQIDEYLGPDEFDATIFDSTSMGADAFGGLIRMDGQAAKVIGMEAYCASNTGLVDIVQRYALPDTLLASTLQTAVGISPEGNIGFKISFGNTPDFDNLSSGLISVRILWLPK